MLMKRYPPMSEAIESTPTFEQAIARLLADYLAHRGALVQVSQNYLQLSAPRNDVEYYGCLVFEETKEDRADKDAFGRLYMLGNIIRVLTNWSDGKAESQPRPPQSANGYQITVPEEHEELTRTGVAQLATQWILGRDVDWSGLEGPSLASALELAVELELVDPAQPIEGTIKSLLADA